ncbi:MAG: hypothetical protein FD166_829 [Bacteroidetes bacterium]|nr:MAG: hypothetical protein FD166_829 [Bacteroidota bacterium]
MSAYASVKINQMFVNFNLKYSFQDYSLELLNRIPLR